MTYAKKVFQFTYQAQLKMTSPKDELHIWLAKPVSSKCQAIRRFTTNFTPSKRYLDDQGNCILYFHIKAQARPTLKVSFQAVLAKDKNEIKKLISAKPQVVSRHLSRFIKDEAYLEQTPQVRQLARQLTEGKRDATDKVQAIYEFVKNSFHYQYPVVHRGVKNLDLTKPQGDCGEYSALFVALCRAVGVPARNVSGFAVFPRNRHATEHGWAEVYLKPLGWTTVDTMFASLERNPVAARNKYFMQQSDYRLVLSRGFNLPLRPVAPRGFRWDFWEKSGLPMNSRTVQILQPLVFATTRAVQFKDHLSFK